MDIKVSVIIPTSNRPKLLAKCLDALVLQQFSAQEFEIIVVVDGSNSGVLLLMDLACQFYADYNIRYFSTVEKRGPAAARNKGWQEAKGELILFTDDDCLVNANWMQDYWDAYQKSSESKLSAFTGTIQVPVNKHPTDFEKNTARLEEAEFVTANCACTRETLEKVNGFDESFTMAWREDSDLHFKIVESCIPVMQVKEALVIHPVRKAGWGISLKEQKKSMFNALLYKKYPDLYKQKIGISPLWNYYAMIIVLLTCIIALLFNIQWLTVPCFILWIIQVMVFTIKRLYGTSLSILHVTEMIFTSMFIPFLSIYWTLYGSLKFKKLLL